MSVGGLSSLLPQFYRPVPPADRPYAMAAYALSGIGPFRAKRLQTEFGSFRAAWQAGADAYRSLGLSQRQLDAVVRSRGQAPAGGPEGVDDLLAKWSIRAAFYGDAAYPLGLTAIHDPPLVVYIRGELLAAVGCAVVGTRRASPYGRWMAARVAGGLARAGWCVISGLALGIDGAAHEAALSAGGLTVAVLAGGLHQPYPPEHVSLASRIVDGRGALVSEYLPGTPTVAGNFLARNRLISGLSAGVVVVEAGRRSGAMSTAGFACEQGRDVMAIPGRAGDPGSAGTHALIRDGAVLVESAHDVITAISGSPLLTGASAPVTVAGSQAVRTGPVSRGDHPQPGPAAISAELLAMLSNGPASEPQLIAALSRYGPGSVRASLLLLEVEGRIERLEGAIYSSRG